ncbi:MAG: DUF2225 domain-containing protein [Lachnospiraceae bacterium]|nr:DUF2225 domain-containing protein [Lachnospiraceae bacterium]
MDDAIAKEKTLLLDRRYTCPICDKQIRAKSVKSNSAKFVDTMADLMPIHNNINVTKYDAVCCPNCGFAALTKNFTTTTSIQRKLIHEQIEANYKSHEEVECDIYTTEVAISRMKMVLLCTVTKGGKESEIGNVCVKISWLYQSLAEEVSDDDPNAEEKRAMYIKEADNAALNAYEHLSKARMTEDFPIAGMNETTLDYLLAYYAYKKGEYQTCMQYLSGVVSNRNTTPRLKDKSLELKDLVAPKLHENQ